MLQLLLQQHAAAAEEATSWLCLFLNQHDFARFICFLRVHICSAVVSNAAAALAAAGRSRVAGCDGAALVAVAAAASPQVRLHVLLLLPLLPLPQLPRPFVIGQLVLSEFGFSVIREEFVF